MDIEAEGANIILTDFILSLDFRNERVRSY